MFKKLKDYRDLFRAMPRDEQDRIRSIDHWTTLLALLLWSVPFGIMAVVMFQAGQALAALAAPERLVAESVLYGIGYGFMAGLGPIFAVALSTMGTIRRIKAWHKDHATAEQANAGFRTGLDA